MVQKILPGKPLEKNLSKLMGEAFTPGINRLLEQIRSLADGLGLPVFLVGGIVRDLLLDVPNEDIDLVVDGDGIQFAHALGAVLGGRVTCHEKFGTAAWQLDPGLKIDIATARREHYEYPAALPVVEPSSLKEDLNRRDFTINAMAIRLNGHKQGWLVDYFHGYRDLKQKKISILYHLSFVDDPTRIIRAVRFESRLGFQMDGQTLGMALNSVENIAFLSKNRITNEFRLLFREPSPAAAIRRLSEVGAWDYLLPGGPDLEQSIGVLTRLEPLLEQLMAIGKKDRAEAGTDQEEPGIEKERYWVCYLAALFYDGNDQLGGIIPKKLGEKNWIEQLKEFSLTNKERQVIREIDSLSHQWSTIWERLAGTGTPALSPVLPGHLHRELKNYSAEAITFTAAAVPLPIPGAMDQIISYCVLRDKLQLPISGADLLTLGLKPGPLYTEIFRELEIAMLNGQLGEKEAVLQWIKAAWQ